MLNAHFGSMGKFSALRSTGEVEDWSTPRRRAARMSLPLTSTRRAPVSRAASCPLASVWFRRATLTQPSTKSSALAASCSGEVNSVPASPTPTSPTPMATKSKSGMNEAVALGFRAHWGWTIMVAVAGSLRKPVVLERRRIVTADAAIPGSKQPYHAAERLDVQKAETLIRLSRDSSTLLATGAVSAVVARLAQKGHRVIGTGILFASGRPLPDLATTLQSHALLHTAEGEFLDRKGVV